MLTPKNKMVAPTLMPATPGMKSWIKAKAVIVRQLAIGIGTADVSSAHCSGCNGATVLSERP